MCTVLRIVQWSICIVGPENVNNYYYKKEFSICIQSFMLVILANWERDWDDMVQDQK
jgi:hypothetical protein